MDKNAQDNKANQKNPNNSETGPGKPHGYSGDVSNVDNRANQLNPNNSQPKSPKK